MSVSLREAAVLQVLTVIAGGVGLFLGILPVSFLAGVFGVGVIFLVVEIWLEPVR
jgi:hypothetical protein